MLEHTKNLARVLPEAENSGLESDVLLQEMKAGGLEWAHSREVKDGMKVGQYLYGRVGKSPDSLSSEEQTTLESSPIRPYLFDKRK